MNIDVDVSYFAIGTCNTLHYCFNNTMAYAACHLSRQLERPMPVHEFGGPFNSTILLAIWGQKSPDYHGTKLRLYPTNPILLRPDHDMSVTPGMDKITISIDSLKLLKLT